MTLASATALPGSPVAKQQFSSTLHDKLAGVLPRGYKFTVHHLSTPPTRTDPLCSPPPGARPDRTYRESHFLAVSIDAIARLRDRSTPTSLPSSPFTPGTASSDGNLRQVLVLALEIFIFTTAWSTTFFVSKADSTGYLHLLNLPKGTPSPIREVCAAFISYLVEERRRANVQTVVSLFARAQNQYLFPGSVENKGKHVLDDRGLVRWWCRVLNSVMEGQGGHEDALFRPAASKGGWENKKAYLVVPGLDLHESRAFLPRNPAAQSNWSLAHPLERISHFASEYDWVPPRCLVPKFPDDPKSRYRDELDFEASKSAQYEEKGLWRSITTMDRFWEMMAFRQECSGGHMTGFLWLVLEPHGWEVAHKAMSPTEPLMSPPSASFDGSLQFPITPPKRRDGLAASTPRASPLKLGITPGSMQQSPSKKGDDSPAKRTKKVLKGPIQPRLPRVKKHARNYIPNIPTSTIYYSWPAEGRGTRIVAEADYNRAVDLLMRLDFETLELAVRSSKTWTREVGGGQKWALDIVGRAAAPVQASVQASTINDMVGLIRRKLKTSDSGLGLDDMETVENTGPSNIATSSTASVTLLAARRKPKEGVNPMTPSLTPRSTSVPAAEPGSATVNVLVPRKKHKESIPDELELTADGGTGSKAEAMGEAMPAVNVLSSEMLRKKPKTG